MKKGINLVILAGNIGRDPEIKYLQSGKSVSTFSMATPASYKRDGELKDDIQWHNITCFGRLAEIAGEYLSKGSEVLIVGKIKNEKYEDKEGNKKQINKVIALDMCMLGKKYKEQQTPEEPGTDDVPF